MRSVAPFAEYVLQVIAVSSQIESKKDRKAVRGRSKHSKQSWSSRWWRGVLERLAVVMVVAAIFQFIRRLCVLVIGLLRLSYRKVCISSLTHRGGSSLSNSAYSKYTSCISEPRVLWN